MTLNQHQHKEVGDNVSADDWNDLVDENWDIAGAWHLAGADLSTLAAGTQLGAVGWLCGVKKTINFQSLRLAIPNRAHTQHLRIVMSGLRSDYASTFDPCQVVFNDDTTATNYYYTFTYSDGVSEAQSQKLGTEAYIRCHVPAASQSAGCYGAVEMMIYNYRLSHNVKYFSFTAISPGRGSGAATVRESSGGGGFWTSDVISSMTISPFNGTQFICEGTNYPTFVCDVYGIAGNDDL